MIKIANHYVSRVVFLLLIAEICILLAASYLGVNLRFLGKGHWPSVYEQFMPSAVTFVIAMVMGMSALGMYQRNLSEGFRSTLLRLMPSFAIGLGILLIIFYVAPELYLGRGVLLLVFFIAAVGILVVRTVFFTLSKSKVLVPKIIFLGAGELVNECIETAKNNIAHHKYDIVGAIPVADEEGVGPKAIIGDGAAPLVTANK